MQWDSSPEKRGETDTEAISVPMHEQLFYLVGFHYSYEFLEVNLIFIVRFSCGLFMNPKFRFQQFLDDFYPEINDRAGEGFEYRDEDGTSIFVIQFDRYWNGCAN